MPKLPQLSHEPALYIALAGAVAAAVVNSGLSPQLSQNAEAYNSLIVLICGLLTRFFVTPNAKVQAPADAPPPSLAA